MNPKYIEKLKLILYVFFWGVVLYGATFPLAFSEFDFDFLKDPNNSMKYLFALTMIVVLHLIDTAYSVLTTPDIDVNKLKYGFVLNLSFLALTAIFMVLTVSTSTGFLVIKKIFFFLVWFFVLGIKYSTIKMITPTIIELDRIDDTK